MLRTDRMRLVTVSLDEELDRVLVELAVREAVTRSELVRRLLRAGLAREKGPGEEPTRHR
jgi:metal-responsive CopG/Arc/MetJ family transcriptional regulator